jgi:hypothetical protein
MRRQDLYHSYRAKPSNWLSSDSTTDDGRCPRHQSLDFFFDHAFLSMRSIAFWAPGSGGYRYSGSLSFRST